MSYELLPHTADMRARLRAPDLPALYGAAVDLVRDMLVGDSPVLARDVYAVEVPPEVGEGERLFRFVRELLYLFDVEGFIPARMEDEASLTVTGESFDPERHTVVHQPKAVTRHGYVFRRTAEGCEVDLVLDL
jgi:SHS2 domain-containing protein